MKDIIPSFFLCPFKDPLPLLFTEHANNFYKKILNYGIVVTIILGVAFMAAARGVNDRLRSLGFSFLWVSIPFILVSFFASQIAVLVSPGEIKSIIGPVIDDLMKVMFEPVIMIYVYILIVGISLVAVGYLFKPEMLQKRKK